MGFRIAGIQPVYLPWLGYFDQMRRVDAFLIADELPFSSSGWAHRNRIKGPNGPHWLNLPARPEHGQPIKDVRLDPHIPWTKKHLSLLRQFYARGVEVDDVLAALRKVLDPSADHITAVTTPVTRLLAEWLGIRTPILVSSELGLEARYVERFPQRPGPTYRIIAYMEALGANELLEGESGQSYFDVALFESHGMKVRFHLYEHPVYPQLHGPFLSHMSALDLLLCVGRERAAEVLKSGKLRDEP